MATTINPYAGDLDLTDWTGITLFNKGSEPLTTKFDNSPKNLQPFLADLPTQANECHWTGILTIADTNHVDQNLLMEHGFLTQDNVNVGIQEWQNIVANNAHSVAHTQLVIHSQMMHKWIKDSLTPAYLKILINILANFWQDGPKLIYHIITNTHVESILSTHDLLQDLRSLELKKLGYNIKKLHAKVDHLVAQLKVNKAQPDDLTIMMHLIAAYRTNSMNTQFLQHVSNLKSDWLQGVITTSSQLRTQCETHVNTMVQNWNWQVQHAPKTKPTALVSDATKQPQPSTQDPQDAITKLKSKNAAWKFKHSETTQTTLMKNGKTYHCCTSPGHQKVGMWVIHEPGTCNTSTTKCTPGTPQVNVMTQVACRLREVVRAKTNSRHILPKPLLTTIPSAMTCPNSSRKSWTSTSESYACGLASAGRFLLAWYSFIGWYIIIRHHQSYSTLYKSSILLPRILTWFS